MPALVAEGGAGAGVAGPVFGLVVGEAGGGDAVVLVPACHGSLRRRGWPQRAHTVSGLALYRARARALKRWWGPR